MAKRIVFTIILVIIVILYSCMALRPPGFVASLQDQDNTTAVQTRISNSGSSGVVGVVGSSNVTGIAVSSNAADSSSVSGSAGNSNINNENIEENIEDAEEKEKFFKNVLTKINPKSIQLSLTEKSDQIFTVWEDQKSVHGVINVLQSAEAGNLSVKPGESLSPYNKTNNIVSGIFLFTLGIMVFLKTLLSLSVPVVFLVIIPIIIVINIVTLWKSKVKGVHRVLIAAIVTSLIVSFAGPVVIKISILADDYIFSKNVNEIVASLEESASHADSIDVDLRSGRRNPAAIQNHITSIKSLSNNVVKDAFTYLLLFTIIFILIPVFSGIGLFKLTRLTSRKIMGKAG